MLVPTNLRSAVATVSLPEPLADFTRTHEGQGVLAVFNLSGQPVPLDLAAFGRLTVLDESGFADPGRHLGPFGAVFARIAED